MAADLLDRDSAVSVNSDVSVDPAVTVLHRTRVLRVFAARNRSGAWAYLDELGWRRVTAASPAGSRDLLAALCRARLAGIEVTAKVTGTAVLAVTYEHGEAARALLPEPRFTGITRGAHRRPTPPRARDGE
jgi:hypothetical protein